VTEYVVAGVSPLTCTETGTLLELAPIVPGGAGASFIIVALGPYENCQLVALPFADTTPFRIAVVAVTFEAVPVVTVGGPAADAEAADAAGTATQHAASTAARRSVNCMRASSWGLDGRSLPRIRSK
jgi:hypothetical protein